MRQDHLPLLACPQCKGDLHWGVETTADGERVREGTLVCAPCQAVFAVEDYVPRFVPAENYATNFGLEWSLHARTQYDSYSGVNASEERFFGETGWERELSDESILEVGGGSGRFTEQAASTGATVVSIDYSSAVDVNHAANGHRDNVLIVQADLFHLPFREGLFDKLFCFGVLQHTPNPHEAFCELPFYVRSGGKLVVDVYRRYGGLRGLLATKYWFRPATKRIPKEVLYRWCTRYVKLMWPLAKYIHRLPKGSYLNWRLLLADYRDEYPLSEEMQREWAILDIFDKLSPAYDSPQFLETVEMWFRHSPLTDVDVRYGYNGIQARGTKV